MEIFFKTKDATKFNEWYIKHLGFTQSEDGGILFEWRNTDAPEKKVILFGEHLKKTLLISNHPKRNLWLT